MGEPLSITGHKVTGYFANIDLAIGAAKRIVAEFDAAPPATEREWVQFYRRAVRLLGALDEAQRNAQQGLDVARANGLISHPADPGRAIDELITQLEAMKR